MEVTNDYMGVCKFCGLVVLASEETREERNISVTEECKCFESRRFRHTKEANTAIDLIFENYHENIIASIKDMAKAVIDSVFETVTLKLSGESQPPSVKISMNDKGLKIQVTQKDTKEKLVRAR